MPIPVPLELRLIMVDKYRYTPSHSLTKTTKILNVVPADFDHDGRLDLLIMSEERNGRWWGGDKVTLDMDVHLQASDGSFGTSLPHVVPSMNTGEKLMDIGEVTWTLDPTTDTQGIVFDADGSLKPSILGVQPQESGDGLLRLWHNDGMNMFMCVSACALGPKMRR